MPEFAYECIVDRGFHWRAKSSSLVVFVYSSVAMQPDNLVQLAICYAKILVFNHGEANN